MKTPIAVRNDNPLNIRFSPMNDWRGQVGSERGFCRFDSIYNGARAAMVLLCNYVRKGFDTIPSIISRWAPASENDTKAYMRFVALGIAQSFDDPDDDNIISRVYSLKVETYREVAEIAYQMARFEIGVNYLNRNPSYDLMLYDVITEVAKNEKLPKLS